MKKITLLVFSILVFSNLIFAQPSGGPGGHGGPGGPSGPSGAPSGFGSHGSGAPGGGWAPGGGNAPSGGNPPSGIPVPPPPAPPAPPPSGGGSHSSSGSSSPVIINYRGERKAASDLPLEILGTSLVKKNNFYNFVIHFNQSVAPEKITCESVFFDGKNIGSDVIIKFNRRADSITFIWSQALYSENEIKELSILLKKIQTFDGKFIEELIVK